MDALRRHAENMRLTAELKRATAYQDNRRRAWVAYIKKHRTEAGFCFEGRP